jgi:hypothetical protein
MANPASETDRGEGGIRYNHLARGVIFRSHLLLVLFLTIRSTVAAQTQFRGRSATHKAALRHGGHCE